MPAAPHLSALAARAAALLLLLAGATGCESGDDDDDTPPDDGSAAVLEPLAPIVTRPGGALLFVPTQTGLTAVNELAIDPDDRWLDDFGAGLSVLDCDSDGDADLFFAGSAGPNLLYRNDGQGRFELVADSGVEFAGDVAVGAATADFDEDGDDDLYVVNQHTANRLLVGDGACRFEDRAPEAGVDDSYRSAHAAFIDLDNDSCLDLYVSNVNDRWPYGEPGFPPDGAHPDRLYLSDCAGGFTDHTDELPRDTAEAYGMVTGFWDYDGDGDLDAYQSNDRGGLFVPNRMWRNDGGLRWVDVTGEAGLAYAGPGMGFALWDFDLDEDIDIFHVSHEELLFVRRGDEFVESGLEKGFGATAEEATQWGGSPVDLDLDGDEDIYFIESHFFDAGVGGVPGPARLFRNDLQDGTFTLLDMPGALGEEHSWRGQSAVDLNGDGVPDLVHGVAGGAPVVFFANPPEGGAALEVRIEGTESNRDGRGAIVRVHAGGRVMTRLPGAVYPFETGGPTWSWFGLGDAEQAERVEVFWPDGSVDRVTDVPAGHRVFIRQGDS